MRLSQACRRHDTQNPRNPVPQSLDLRAQTHATRHKSVTPQPATSASKIRNLPPHISVTYRRGDTFVHSARQMEGCDNLSPGIGLKLVEGVHGL
jgi:hypothetical protein